MCHPSTPFRISRYTIWLKRAITVFSRRIVMAKSCISTKSHLCSKQNYFQQSYTVIGKIAMLKNRIRFSRKSKFQQSYTFIGESENFQNDRFSMNVIVSAPKLSKAEHKSPSEIQMDCLLIGLEVSFRMAHSQSALGAFHST